MLTYGRLVVTKLALPDDPVDICEQLSDIFDQCEDQAIEECKKHEEEVCDEYLEKEMPTVCPEYCQDEENIDEICNEHCETSVCPDFCNDNLDELCPDWCADPENEACDGK